MAIRRVSDLPELTSIYQNADLDKCLFEVSYKNDNIYQSFYAKGKTVTDKVVKKIGGSIDLTKYVTKGTDELITGLKSFSNSSGIMVNGTYLSSVNDNGNAIENSSREDDIKQVPSLKAVKDFVESKGYIDALDESWKAPLEMLKSMLSQSILTLYVNLTSGDDAKDGESVLTAVKTLEKALEIANERKYIKASHFIIYVIGIYKVTANSNGTFTSLLIYHPDMNGSRYGYIRGYDSDSELLIDYNGITNWYSTWLYVLCNIRIENIKITAIWDKNNAGGGEFPTNGTYTLKINYIYNASWAGTGITTQYTGLVIVKNVKISGFRWGITGNARINDGVEFNNCTIVCTPNNGSIYFDLLSKIYVKGICLEVIGVTNLNSAAILPYGAHIDVLQCKLFIVNDSGSAFTFRLYNTAVPAYLSNTNNPYGIKIHKIIGEEKTDGTNYEFNMSDDIRTCHFLVKATDNNNTKLNKLKNYLASIFGNNANKIFIEANTITPDFTNSQSTNLHFNFNYGPGTNKIEANYSTSEAIDYLIKICYLNESDWL